MASLLDRKWSPSLAHYLATILNEHFNDGAPRAATVLVDALFDEPMTVQSWSPGFNVGRMSGFHTRHFSLFVANGVANRFDFRRFGLNYADPGVFNTTPFTHPDAARAVAHVAADFVAGVSPSCERLCLVGHSGGGVVAVALLSHIMEHGPQAPLRCVTFGMPRCGNHAFVNRIDSLGVERYFLNNDGIPFAPPSAEYLPSIYNLSSRTVQRQYDEWESTDEGRSILPDGTLVDAVSPDPWLEGSPPPAAMLADPSLPPHLYTEHQIHHYVSRLQRYAGEVEVHLPRPAIERRRRDEAPAFIEELPGGPRVPSPPLTPTREILLTAAGRGRRRKPFYVRRVARRFVVFGDGSPISAHNIRRFASHEARGFNLAYFAWLKAQVGDAASLAEVIGSVFPS